MIRSQILINPILTREQARRLTCGAWRRRATRRDGRGRCSSAYSRRRAACVLQARGRGAPAGFLAGPSTVPSIVSFFFYFFYLSLFFSISFSLIPNPISSRVKFEFPEPLYLNLNEYTMSLRPYVYTLPQPYRQRLHNFWHQFLILPFLFFSISYVYTSI